MTIGDNIMTLTPQNISFRAIGSEIDALFSEMETRAANLLAQTNGNTLSTKMKNTSIPAFGNTFQVDVSENENEIIVTTDLPGLEKKDIAVRLLNPQKLLIKTEVQEETADMDCSNTYHIRERKFSNMQRNIYLPAPVVGEGVKASFKNGVMEIILPKDKSEVGLPIKIQ